MTQVVTPSKSITKGQAGKFVDVAVDALVKSGLSSEPTQQVLENQGAALADEFVGLVRKRVEAITGMIVRRVTVDRSRTPQTMLNATGRKQYTIQSVVDAMPRGEDNETDVFFFKPDPAVYKDGWISEDEVVRQYELRGLKADPYAQGAVNEVDPAFADEHPNGTQWKDVQGKWCFAIFDRWAHERHVDVHRGDNDWDDYWFFAGVRK